MKLKISYIFKCDKCSIEIVDYITSHDHPDAHKVICPKCGNLLYDPNEPPKEPDEPDFDLDIERKYEADWERNND